MGALTRGPRWKALMHPGLEMSFPFRPASYAIFTIAQKVICSLFLPHGLWVFMFHSQCKLLVCKGSNLGRLIRIF